jgi:hypothetical protein
MCVHTCVYACACWNHFNQTGLGDCAQVANGRTAEEEFEIALQRAKDRAEAREHYFADARRQFEETRANWERDIAREKSLRIEAERWSTTATPPPPLHTPCRRHPFFPMNARDHVVGSDRTESPGQLTRWTSATFPCSSTSRALL